jgi:septal ring factor EnvC (AmiA/AmiB activator)
MNPETPQPEQLADESIPAGEPSPKRLVNPNLTGSLAADHAALQNDLVQAQELAADFQRQLAGKSNEHAQLKQILEKTERDLAHFQEGIVELRAERHRLANEAMRATAFQMKLAKITGERDRLRVDLEIVRQAMAVKGEEVTTQLLERDRRIAELVVEMVSLRGALEEARNRAPATAAPSGPAKAATQPTVQPFALLDDPEVEIMREQPAIRKVR